MRPRVENTLAVAAPPTPNTSDARIERWRVPGVEGIELHKGSRVTQEHPRHWHEEFYLCATLNGTSYLQSRGTSLSTPRGTLALVAPGDIHANRKIACDFRCLFMDFRTLRNIVEQFLQRKLPPLGLRSGLIDDQQAASRFCRVHLSLEEEASEFAGTDLLSFLTDLLARHSTATIPLPKTGSEDSAVRRSRQFLNEHYADRVSLGQLASLTGLSAYHLNRSFRRALGIPPHEYQLQLRINKAKSLLRLGRSISETAFLVGFVDQSHFTRHFKRSVLLTPGQFLRQSKNVQDSPPLPR
jgi:AraC-like DNA-binding protein